MGIGEIVLVDEDGRVQRISVPSLAFIPPERGQYPTPFQISDTARGSSG